MKKVSTQRFVEHCSQKESTEETMETLISHGSEGPKKLNEFRSSYSPCCQPKHKNKRITSKFAYYFFHCSCYTRNNIESP